MQAYDFASPALPVAICDAENMIHVFTIQVVPIRGCPEIFNRVLNYSCGNKTDRLPFTFFFPNSSV